MKRRLRKGEKIFSLSMRRSGVIIGPIVSEPRQYLVRSVDAYGVGHEVEEWVYDLVPLQRDCAARRNRDLVRQLEKIVRQLEK
jgi:hypothetical protein